MQRQNGWLLAQLRLEGTDETVFEAMSIPGVGLFGGADSLANCRPDQLEGVGMFGELALFFLSQAFESGPSAVEAEAERNVEGEPVEIRFLQGLLHLKSQWKASVSVVPVAAGQIQAEILRQSEGRQPMRIHVEWFAQTDDPIVADDEPLSDWKACWLGNRRSGSVDYAFEPKDRVETFGDIRDYLARCRTAC